MIPVELIPPRDPELPEYKPEPRTPGIPEGWIWVPWFALMLAAAVYLKTAG